MRKNIGTLLRVERSIRMKKWEKGLLEATLVATLMGGTASWGQQATAPSAATPARAMATAAVKPMSKVNINTADETGLMSLKGVGKTKAQAIIDYRQKNGPFKTIDDLARVKGIGEKTVGNLKDQITVE
jgi:competence protein ComEA